MSDYRERVPWPFWGHLLLALGILLLVAAALGGLVKRGLDWPAIVGLLVAVVIGVVWWRMRFLELSFDAEGASFGFGGLGRHVPRERLSSAEVEAYSVARYMGWGYRLGWKPRERAYSILGRPRGVRLVFRDEEGREWTVFLSSRDPESAVRALEK